MLATNGETTAAVTYDISDKARPVKIGKVIQEGQYLSLSLIHILKALKDDKNVQVNYLCSTVVRQDALEKYPGLEEALMKMDGLFSDKEMAELNYQVEVEGRDEQEVAHQFLVEKGVVEE